MTNKLAVSSLFTAALAIYLSAKNTPKETTAKGKLPCGEK